MAHAPIRAVDRLFDIVEAIQVRNGAGVSELADALDMPKSTIHGHLATLRDRGYLEQDETNDYHLSLQFLTLGGAVRQQRTIYGHVEPLLAELAEETGESVNYVVESQGKLVFVGSVSGKDGIRTEVDIGFTTDLHTTPEGKLTLAHLPETRRAAIIDQIEFPIDNSVGRAAFTAELEAIREQGFTHGNETIIKNVTTIAAPVIDNQDRFYGTVVVAGPSLRFTEERLENVTETLRYKIGKLNIDLSYEGTRPVTENQVRTARPSQ
ncbi:IclR family transcriptional regulator [Halodesulfurarchaeum formicicum]|uniref:IclR family transcriptional regulator n=1 Tax=Halodesulfurarchaeum formicicum TaxID=1873524 RepID=A0A1J1AET4_9EURY|nr:IclR family transcriptional regulator [Halodesulfurarchaeum formicicum]APE96223.1 IclR family transcriptional regulator [Halodesulfurarchaeum formicicum]